jgi:hypothetical protein
VGHVESAGDAQKGKYTLYILIVRTINGKLQLEVLELAQQGFISCGGRFRKNKNRRIG